MDAKIDAMEITRLKDVYGALLTDRQAEMLSLFYDFDNSLSEIAEQYGVSRQAVRDVIERAKVQLAELEVKLGFAKKIEETLEICKRLRTSYRERDDAAVLAEIPNGAQITILGGACGNARSRLGEKEWHCFRDSVRE